jgi:transposase
LILVCCWLFWLVVRGVRNVKSKVELFEQIRLAERDEGLSIRALAVRFHVHRREVRLALASPEPPPRVLGSRWPSPVSGDWHGWIRDVLVADFDAPVKQRHTAKRIHDRLAAEHGVVISASQCRAVVARIRVEIAADDGVARRVVFVPQTRGPGAEAEVDWGKFTAVIGGETMTLSLFAMWLAFSTKAFHYAYVNEAQESFTDAHSRAFHHFGGVPRRVRYDNLKTAAIKILRGRSRVENDRLRSHYGFESFFCEPGIKGAHEKGGVEADIGRFRRNHLTPVPVFETLTDLNAHIASADLADSRRFVTGPRIGPGSAGDTVHGLWVFEQGAMHPLAAELFDASSRLTARVDTKARVCVRNCYYSVPARHVGTLVTVRLGAEQITITTPTGGVIAVHERAIHRRSETLLLDHYLEVLWKRPGGLPASTALVQARRTGRFTGEHQQFWDRAKRVHGDRDGTRLLCEVLLLHRTLNHAQLKTGIVAALHIGSTDPAVVAVEARRSIEHIALPPILERPPMLDQYDLLLNNINKGNL